MTESSTARARLPRYDIVDALRGVAMVWMTVFHFCFDLSHLGLWRQNFLVDPFWTNQRVLIVSLFLFCAGLGQSIAWAQGQSWARFFRRWLQIVLAALLVSVGSYLVFPQSYIYFGVLHGIAVMLLIVRCTSSWGRWLWFAGLLAVLSPWAAQSWLSGMGEGWAALMNGRSLNWLGWITQKPFTEDYVPIFPWLGVMWWGMAAGQWLQRAHRDWLTRSVPAGTGWLALMGRWSLSYYLLHQPILLGMLSAVVWLTRR
ncbi:heparan-alpha-glucosaminide N-acetyltransferase [Diaphorobacter caeni]|uniref:heparan-alpha-glucosaminide N-acetyltransferase n=1 Tax=Diaphorobacter caeni TaxID=2784387 RepID=UPI00188EE485|nr:heparan-alpha-glucosaminide N-acetyltransferase [Diaphorobacter caeni]MBF5004736.1 DUF1624 domain-containing protein [Diaphorobacter caeni]